MSLGRIFLRHFRWMLAPAVVLAAGAQPAANKAYAGGELVVYKHVEGAELTLEILKPKGWTAQDHRPALLFFHGGSWILGNPGQLALQGKHFADRGLVSVLVKYRLLTKGEKIPPQVCLQDAKSAMRWVRSRAAAYGIDPERIGAVGASAGGQLAAYLAFGSGFDEPGDDLGVSTHPQALILFNPVVDFGPGNFGHELMGAEWEKYSPALMVVRGAPPTLIMVGSKDKILPSLQKFRVALVGVDAPCTLKVYEGQGHSFFNQKKGGNPFFDQTLRAADDFVVSLGWLEAAAP